MGVEMLALFWFIRREGASRVSPSMPTAGRADPMPDLASRQGATAAPPFARTCAKSPARNTARSFFSGALLALAVAICAFGALYGLLGSAGTVCDALGGRGLVAPSEVVIGPPAEADGRSSVAVRLCNVTLHKITVVGASRSCNCLTTSRLPQVVAPWGSIELQVARDWNGTPARDEDLTLITDDATTGPVRITIKGTGEMGIADRN